MTATAPRLATLGLLLACLTWPVHAEQSQDFGDYVIHYNALGTDTLSPDMAKAYGITRSRNRALLNVTVLKKVLGTPGRPVTAQVRVTATNMSRQMQTLEPREVHEGNAIYYLSEFNVADQEIIDFDIEVTPETQAHTAHVSFRQQFFTH